MTLDLWLESHPYLRAIASLHVQVNLVAAGLPKAKLPVPKWDDYAPDFREGIPLLLNSGLVFDFRSVGEMVVALVERLASAPLPPNLAEESRLLAVELRGENVPHRAIRWLLFHEGSPISSSGVMRFLGWTALAGPLRPLLEEFARWRDEERWLRSYCPTCGSLPSMAQLAGEPARQRFLCCGCCRTRWQYRRAHCPFCDNDEDRQFAVMAIEGEGLLRIDFCMRCGGYLKTYVGSGSEEVFLADWTSLHLDLIACDRGLTRLAPSLYSLRSEALQA